MNTHETYVSLEIAKLLKQAGFDWECSRYYQNGDETLYGPIKLISTNFNVAPVYTEQYNAPTLDVAQKWLREVKNISVEIISTRYSEWEYIIRKINQLNHNDNIILTLTACRFYTYEEALEAGIKRCLKEYCITDKYSEE